MAVRVHLLQGLAVCAHCGRRLRIQTPKNFPTYYREDSHLRGYHDCPFSGQSIHADKLDEQVDALIQSLKLTATWEEDVRKLVHDERDRPYPETERKEIRIMLRLMRDNYERGMYEWEEYQYWQKVNALKEKLELLNRIPEAAIDQAARSHYLAAGEALLASFDGIGWFLNTLLGGISLLISSLLMLRSNLYSKATAYVGIVSNAAVCSFFIPFVGIWLLFLSVLGYAIWYFLLARKFFQLGRGD